MSVKKINENTYVYTDKWLWGFGIRFGGLIYFGYQGITGIAGTGDYTLFGGILQLIIATFFLLFGKSIQKHITAGPIIDLEARSLLLPAGILNIMSTGGGKTVETVKDGIGYEVLDLDEITGLSSRLKFEQSSSSNSLTKKNIISILGKFGSRTVTIYENETYDSFMNTISVNCGLE